MYMCVSAVDDVNSLCTLVFQVDVAGTMYFWGVTIDTASSILLTLCVGLAVDYSAHIGHTFMTVSGSKNGTIFSNLTVISLDLLGLSEWWPLNKAVINNILDFHSHPPKISHLST
jgi:hypothetical protein